MNQDPLRSIKAWFGALILVLWIAVVGVDIWVVYSFDPVSFQRLASVWAAVLLGVFGLTRTSIWEVNQAVKGQGPLAKWYLQASEPIKYDQRKGWRNYLDKEGRAYSRPLLSENELKNYFEDLEDFLTRKIQPAELVLGFKVALQGGYGDIFSCWINGRENGWC